MSRSFAMLVACSLLVASAAEAGGPGSFRLRFRPTVSPATYRMAQVDRTSDEPAGAPPRWEVQQVAWETVQQIRDSGGGLIVAGALAAGSALTPAAVPVEFATPLPPDGRSDRPREAGAHDATALMRPVFPEAEIQPGHTWQTEEPLAADPGVRVAVSHEFLEVQLMQGMPCAVVASRAELRGRGDDATTALVFAGSSRTVISLTSGELMSFEGYTALALRSTPRAGGAPRVFRAECLRTEVRGAVLTDPENPSDGSAPKPLTVSGAPRVRKFAEPAHDEAPRTDAVAPPELARNVD